MAPFLLTYPFFHTFSLLVIRDIRTGDAGYKILQQHCLKASHGTVYDMDVDSRLGTVITVGQVI